MALYGLKGYHSSTVNQLITAVDNDMVNVTTGLGYSVNLLSTTNVEFENFLESLFFQNFSDTPLTFNGTKWSRRHVGKLPVSRYLKAWRERLYLGYVQIRGTNYPSRVWYSDLPINDTIRWGYETGTNLVTTAASPRVTSALAGFKGQNIKRGDPFFILSGNDAGQYSVKTIVSDMWLDLADYNGNDINLTTSATGLSYWVGSNWFDVERDDGDFVTWLEINRNIDNLLIFKRESLFRYDGTRQIRIKGAPGTTSGRSVVDTKDMTIYFFGGQGLETGFYATDGSEGIKISNPIQKYIDGINAATTIVGWKENNLYRAYVGDISNTDYNISITNAVVSYDLDSKAWSIDPQPKTIIAATEFRQGGIKQAYIADADEVFLTPSGNTHDGTAIKFSFEIGNIYPNKTHYSNTLTRLQVISENAKGIKVLYRRKLTPFDSDQEYTPLGDIKHEATWFNFPETKNQCAGLDVRFEGISSTESTAIIKKLVLGIRKDTTIVQ